MFASWRCLKVVAAEELTTLMGKTSILLLRRRLSSGGGKPEQFSAFGREIPVKPLRPEGDSQTTDKYPSSILKNCPALLWFYVACFWCQRFGDVTPDVCSYSLSLVSIAEFPPFGKCNIKYFPIWF